MKQIILCLMTLFVISGCSGDTDKWIPIKFNEQRFSIEMLSADIEIPAIRKEGKAKFLKSDSAFELGYLINFDFDPLDVSKLPKKYLHEKKITVDGKTWTLLPTTAVSVLAEMTFYLKDRDGFTVDKLTSKPFSILSGSNSQIEKHTLQDTLGRSIGAETVRRTEVIEVDLIILKCQTCSR